MKIKTLHSWTFRIVGGFALIAIIFANVRFVFICLSIATLVMAMVVEMVLGRGRKRHSMSTTRQHFDVGTMSITSDKLCITEQLTVDDSAVILSASNGTYICAMDAQPCFDGVLPYSICIQSSVLGEITRSEKIEVSVDTGFLVFADLNTMTSQAQYIEETVQKMLELDRPEDIGVTMLTANGEAFGFATVSGEGDGIYTLQIERDAAQHLRITCSFP